MKAKKVMKIRRVTLFMTLKVMKIKKVTLFMTLR